MEVTVSSYDGEVYLSVGEGGYVAGTTAIASEIDKAKESNRTSNSNRQYTGYEISGTGTDIYLYYDVEGGQQKIHDFGATYGSPVYLSYTLNGQNVYFKWDGARWYNVTDDNSTWTKAEMYNYAH